MVLIVPPASILGSVISRLLKKVDMFPVSGLCYRSMND